MSKLTEMRDKALAKGVDALVPVVSKVAGTVQELAEGPVGKAVGTAASVGSHMASKTPVIGRFIGGHDGADPNGFDPLERPNGLGEPVAPGEESAAQAVLSEQDAAERAGSKAAGSKGSGKTSGKAAGAKARATGPGAGRGGTKAPAKKKTVRSVGTTKAPEDGALEARDLAIPGYTKLTVAKITERLDGLTQTDLAALYRFEKANGARAGVLKGIEGRMVQLPLPMYDKLTLPAILDDLNGLTKPELSVIRDYEAGTTNRLPILDRIDELLAVPLPGES